MRGPCRREAERASVGRKKCRSGVLQERYLYVALFGAYSGMAKAVTLPAERSTIRNFICKMWENGFFFDVIRFEELNIAAPCTAIIVPLQDRLSPVKQSRLIEFARNIFRLTVIASTTISDSTMSLRYRLVDNNHDRLLMILPICLFCINRSIVNAIDPSTFMTRILVVCGKRNTSPLEEGHPYFGRLEIRD
jgi:hypothetical protein